MGKQHMNACSMSYAICYNWVTSKCKFNCVIKKENFNDIPMNHS
uniref:Uncharacterized protein n=1 Tax=Anguilla anguilla TaxID=7936 RepID=A0A0E9XZ25_ANGAN